MRITLFLTLFVAGMTGCSDSSESKQSSATKPSTSKTPSQGEAPAEPPAPLPKLEGYSMQELPPSIRRPFASILQEELCGCESTRTLAGCLTKKDACKSSQIMAGLIAGYLKEGMSQTDAQFNFSNTVTNGHCGDPVGLAPGDFRDWPRLHRGGPNSEVVLIEFADFLCGHCAQASPEIEAVISLGLPIDVVFIPVNVGGNPLSKKAGIASLAAFNQGDDFFKRYAKLLYKNQSGLTEGDLPKLAKEAKLDMKRWENDRKDPFLAKQFDQGVTLSNQAGLQGTPYVLINGRPLGVQVVRHDLFARIQLERLRGKDNCE
ncbi:MAG: hypothetical protein CMH50_10265 [Myxococcales bacterium]|nr:hypothetical protein [Myxococcales bacterium]